uniref:Formate dehydrogenase accessory sulfurtransferase FdhD n=1 Tax=Archaeoglobus fulgidus TaxID=2234 RepID=A0A7C3MAX3_ARCFL
MIRKLGKTLELAKESRVTILAGNTPYHLMCTPENLVELAVGFIISEGIASSLKEIEVSMVEENLIYVKMNGKRSSTAITSSGCIGVFRDEEEIPKVKAAEKFKIEELKNALEYLETEEYRRTRGYHTAVVVSKNGIVARMHDVGRHNAVDKAIGSSLLKGFDPSRAFLLLSGRISRGMVMKCARVGIPLIASKAAILDSAIEVCEKSGVAAVSFATNIAVEGEALE